MANSTTLSDLRTRALDFADMTGSAFPVTARLTDYVNDGLAELHDMLAMHDYHRSTSSITLAAGTEEYTLPEDFYKALRVWHLSGGRRYDVPKFTLADLHGGQTTGPQTSGSAELWYVPQLKRLKDDRDRVEVALPIGWESFVALHAAVQLLNREESDAQALLMERERVRQRIAAHVEPRDIGEPDAIEDVYHRWGGGLAESEATLRYRIMGNKIHFADFREV